jgi:hypothetical protein
MTALVERRGSVGNWAFTQAVTLQRMPADHDEDVGQDQGGGSGEWGMVSEPPLNPYVDNGGDPVFNAEDGPAPSALNPYRGEAGGDPVFNAEDGPAPSALNPYRGEAGGDPVFNAEDGPAPSALNPYRGEAGGSPVFNAEDGPAQIPPLAPVPVPASAPVAVAPPPRSASRFKTKGMKGHATESKGSFAFVEDLVQTGALLNDMIRAGLAEPLKAPTASGRKAELLAKNAEFLKTRVRFRVAVKRLWGWTDADVDKYWKYTAKSNATGRGPRKKWRVDYMKTPEARAQYAITPGPVWKQADGKTFDTGGMVSKAGGPGFAIFVMDGDGRVYAGQHRVGLFHHSSFLGGAEVAAAGELKVENGKLKEVTAKSGHYEPTPKHTRQLLAVLHEHNVPLHGVQVKVWKPRRPPATGFNTWLYDSEEFRLKGEAARGRDTGKMF